MNDRRPGTVTVAGLLILLAGGLSGCRGNHVQNSRVYEMLARIGNRSGRNGKPELARNGAAAVVSQCGTASFANVWSGLVAGQTGLHEDVFEMRDPVSLRTAAYRLDDTLQLEEILEEVGRAGATSPDQAECIRNFADHLEAVTDPMIEADNLQKEIDLSAFTKAAKEAHEDKQRELEAPALPETSPAPAKQN